MPCRALLTVLVGLPALGLAQAPERICLTWAADPATTASISWRTATTAAAPGRIEWIEAGSNPKALSEARTSSAASTEVTLPDGMSAQYHRVNLNGLRPDTLYAYRVGHGASMSEWFQFRTQNNRATPFRFLYLGDAQNQIESMWSRVLRQAVMTAPDARFTIHAGDLVDLPNRDSDWAQWFRGGGWIHSSIPVVAAIGNHEYFRSGENRLLSLLWRPQFNYPNNGVGGLEETNWTVDTMGVRLIVLNAMEKLEEQAQWLDAVLTRNPQRWTVVTFHHPIFSTAKNRDNPRHRALWMPILEKHRVDLVLNGHDHSYGRRVGANGQTNYIVSVAGPKMYELNEENTNQMVRAAANTMTYQVVSIDGDRLRYDSYKANGDPFDRFEIVKAAGQRQGRVVELSRTR